MTMTASTLLLVRRLRDARGQRDMLVKRLERLRSSLPEWTLSPLEEVGFSKAEVAELVCDCSGAEQQAALDQAAAELTRLDQHVERLEDQLLMTPCSSQEQVQALLDLALAQLRAKTVGDPDEFFYDAGDARILAVIDRAAHHLRGLIVDGVRLAS